MSSDTPLCDTCELCLFGSLILTLFGALIFVGFELDIDDGNYNIFIVLLICYLVGVYILLSTLIYGYISKKIINLIFGKPIDHCVVIVAILTLKLLLTGGIRLLLNDVFYKIIDINNPFYMFLELFISHIIGCIILIIVYAIILWGIYIKSMRTRKNVTNVVVIEV